MSNSQVQPPQSSKLPLKPSILSSVLSSKSGSNKTKSVSIVEDSQPQPMKESTTEKSASNHFLTPPKPVVKSDDADLKMK